MIIPLGIRSVPFPCLLIFIGFCLIVMHSSRVGQFRSLAASSVLHGTIGLDRSLLLFGTFAAVLIQVAAMYMPWLSDVLQIHPVSMDQWIEFLGIALVVFAVVEVYKLLRRRFPVT